jgi:PAS domain S-box-containing protein
VSAWTSCGATSRRCAADRRQQRARPGLRIEIRLPLTLAIIDGFLVGVGSSKFIFPLDAVVEVIENRPTVTARRRGRSVVELRGQVLPVISLRQLYALDAEAPERSSVVVVQAGTQRYGVIVDQLLGQHQTVIKPLGRMFRSLRGMSGSSILGNGEVALIFDATSLSQLAADPPLSRRRRVRTRQPPAPQHAHTSVRRTSNMNQPRKPSWIARLLAGAELQQAEDQVRQAARPRQARAAREARRSAAERTRRRRGHAGAVPRPAGRGGDRAEGAHRDHEPHEHRLGGRQEGRHPQLQRQVRRGLEVQPQGADRPGHNTTRHPDMPKEVFKQMWSTIGRGEIFRGVVKNRAKDGTPYYVDAVIAPVLGENGKPKKYLGVRYDITEQEIERQNARGILAAIDQSYAYIEFDLGGHVTQANANFLQALGYTLDEIRGKHHRMFCDPQLRPAPAYSQFWADLGAGKPQRDVFKRIAKNGQEVWIQAVYAPVKDEMGRVVKFVKIATDVTAEVKANQMLRQAVEQAQQVTAAAKTAT